MRYLILYVVAIALASLPFAIPAYLGDGAQWLDAPTATPGDFRSLAAFQDGYRNERLGDLSAALAKYRIAENSKLAPVQEAARKAVDRVNAKLNRLGPLYGVLRTLAGWGRALCLPLILVIATGLIVLLLVAISRMTKRLGALASWIRRQED